MKKAKTNEEKILQVLTKLEENAEKRYYKIRDNIEGDPTSEQARELELIETEWTSFSQAISEAKKVLNG